MVQWMRRSLLLVMSVLVGASAFALKGDPVEPGSLSATPVASRDIRVVHETIDVTIDAHFKTAHFDIAYDVMAPPEGDSIPLLFHINDALDNPRVLVDGEVEPLRAIRDGFTDLEGTRYKNFAHAFDDELWNGRLHLELHTSETEEILVDISDLYYFTPALAPGPHRILFSYTASAWTDQSGWVPETSFRFALTPARFYDDFGGITVRVDATDCSRTWTSNLGEPHQGSTSQVSMWDFDELPADILIIRHTPGIDPIAATLIAITPEGIAGIAAILLTILHIYLMWAYRRRESATGFSWPLWFGGVVFPLFAVLVYVFSFQLIDALLGPDATQYRTFEILALILYPILLIPYMGFSWWVDRWIRRRIARSADGPVA